MNANECLHKNPDAEIAVLSFLWADLIDVVLTRKGEFETRDSSEGCKLDNLEIGKLSCKGAPSLCKLHRSVIGVHTLGCS